MINPCIIIPTYNNATTIVGVVNGALALGLPVIVVNDGCTDNTAELLATLNDSITLISYQPNRGKGHALQRALDYAREQGFSHAITMDADGQHRATDLPLFLDAIRKSPDAIILGARGTAHDNMAAKSTFANRFSNFWFAIHTWRTPGDTQTGFRAYPLKRRQLFFTNRYEAELAVLINAVWHGTPIKSIPVNVYYPPRELRVSHFRPAVDFTRISVLNTLVTFAAFFYGYPMMIYHALRK